MNAGSVTYDFDAHLDPPTCSFTDDEGCAWTQVDLEVWSAMKNQYDNGEPWPEMIRRTYVRGVLTQEERGDFLLLHGPRFMHYRGATFTHDRSGRTILIQHFVRVRDIVVDYVLK